MQGVTANGGNVWPLAKLRPNPNNPRADVRADDFDELVASVRAQGILQPLLVSRDGTILAGHRRYEAAKVAGLENVPIRILTEAEPGDFDLICLIENLMRSNLTVLETGNYLLELQQRRMMDVGTISELTGISRDTVRKYLKIAQSPDIVKQGLQNERISVDAALALAGQDDLVIARAMQEPKVTRQVVNEIAAGRVPRKQVSQTEQRQEDISRAIDRMDSVEELLRPHGPSESVSKALASASTAIIAWAAELTKAARRATPAK